MHYKNGREAKNGDKVVQIVAGQTPTAGILYDAVAGNDSCNGRIAVTTPNDPYACLYNVLHADDVAKATVPDSTVPTVPGPNVAATGAAVVAALLLFLGVGCASVDTATFNAENLAADTATGATHVFNQYYNSLTNPPASLTQARTTLYQTDEQMAASLKVLEALRLTYETNAAQTNLTAMQVALETVQLQSTNIVNLVQSFITNK